MERPALHLEQGTPGYGAEKRGTPTLRHMTPLLPWRLASGLRFLADFPRRLAARRSFRRINRVKNARVVLGLGGVLDNRHLVHGGAVKLLHLQEAFPCDGAEFNLLYLVSSAQPAFAIDLAKACKKKEIPLVWNQNGVGYPAWAGGASELHNAAMRKMRNMASFVVYQSSFCRESAERFLGPENAPGEVLFNPVNLQRFQPAKFPLASSPMRLLAMGTQNYSERLFSALECVKHLLEGGVEALLTVAGPLIWKDAKAEVADRIDQLGLRGFVTILPPFTQQDAPDIYRAHHILLHPKYLDPCPTVVAEAMACGLPIVGSGSGGVPEMTDSACAELVNLPQVWDKLLTPSGGELASAVMKIRDRHAEAGRAARQRAEELFDAGGWVQRHREIFSGVLR